MNYFTSQDNCLAIFVNLILEWYSGMLAAVITTCYLDTRHDPKSYLDPTRTHCINNLWELVSMPLILLKYRSTKQGVPDTSSHNRSHLLIEMYSFFSLSVRCLPLIGCDSPFSAAVAIAHPPLLHSSMSPFCPAVFLSSILSSSLSLLVV